MKQISIYQVEDTPLGAGGMGQVLRGTDPQGRPVAIKEILPEFASDFEIRTRTEREVEILQVLNQTDGVVKVYDQFPLNNNFYIVMELVDGVNVEQYVQKYGAIPYERAVRYMTRILAIMQSIHEKEIVHRDMKPSNIMIRNDESICILDFGIAKDMGNMNGGTIVGTIIGSDGYMSPEQADGFSIDHRADIYALGCVFYYMLTGHHAYNTLASDFETRSNITNTPFPKLSKHSRKSFPARLQEILDHATDRNMMRRYQSCREFRKDLESLLPSTSSMHTIIDSNKTENIFITVGREGCDIIIDDPNMKVSRSHLDIAYKQFTGGRYYVITDHSSNGTMVNGRKIRRNESENIPADGAIPQIYLACDGNYPLDWEQVKKLIAKKLKETSPEPTEDPTGGTQYQSIPTPVDSGVSSFANMADNDYTEVTLFNAVALMFKRGFDFSGRSKRSEYWYVVLLYVLISVAVTIVEIAMAASGAKMDTIATVSTIITVVAWIYFLIALIPSLALTVRRLHDVGKSAWWLLISPIPIIGSIYMLILMATESDYDNEWGECPN